MKSTTPLESHFIANTSPGRDSTPLRSMQPDPGLQSVTPNGVMTDALSATLLEYSVRLLTES